MESKKGNNRSQLIASKVQLQMLCLGLLLVILANTFELKVLKVDTDEALANIGVLIFMVGSLQWLFDVSLRQQLQEEISQATIKNIRVATSGISDFLEDSKDVNYAELIRTSASIVVGLNYSPRILEDYVEDFRERIKRHLPTTLFILDPRSEFAALLSKHKEEYGHIEPNIQKVRRMAKELNLANENLLKVRYHSVALRYSFVCADHCVWVKPYRSSEGRTRVPAIQVTEGSPLFRHFRSDIDQLMNQSKAYE